MLIAGVISCPVMCAGADSLPLDEAMEQARHGRSLKDQVASRVGLRAVRQVKSCEVADLAALCKVALAGGGGSKLPSALAVRFQRGDQEKVCVVMLTLPWDLVREGVSQLVVRNSRSFEVGAALELRFRLLLASQRAEALRDAIKSGDIERAKLLVRTSTYAADAREVVVALAGLGLSGDVDDLRWLTLRSIAREERIAKELLALAVTGARPELLTALTRANPELKMQARKHLEKLLVKGRRSPQLLRPAIELSAAGAGRLALHLVASGSLPVRLQALEELPRLSRRSKDARFKASVRRSIMRSLDAQSELVLASLRALGQLEDPPAELLLAYTSKELPRDVRRAAIQAVGNARAERALCLPALTPLLAEEEVSEAAHKTLVLLSGIRLPPRASLWEAWMARN